MSQTNKVNNWIKTPCGRAKYAELVAKIGPIARIRVSWFVLIASLKDLNLPNPDQSLEELSE